MSYRTIAEKTNYGYKTASYFAWAGSNLLAFPKTLALPMVFPPNDWEINSFGGANNGGYLLSSLTDISYQGYIDSKSHRVHDHRLYLKEISHLNHLQKVKFTINDKMVAFLDKHKETLTDSGIVLLTGKWFHPNAKDEIRAKWKGRVSLEKEYAHRVWKDFISKQNETLRNIEMLQIAKLYLDKSIYWPVVQDFRGRVYRIGNLNIQLNEFVRSMIAFQSKKPFVNRKKNKNTLALICY